MGYRHFDRCKNKHEIYKNGCDAMNNACEPTRKFMEYCDTMNNACEPTRKFMEYPIGVVVLTVTQRVISHLYKPIYPHHHTSSVGI